MVKFFIEVYSPVVQPSIQCIATYRQIYCSHCLQSSREGRVTVVTQEARVDVDEVQLSTVKYLYYYTLCRLMILLQGHPMQQEVGECSWCISFGEVVLRCTCIHVVTVNLPNINFECGILPLLLCRNTWKPKS